MFSKNPHAYRACAHTVPVKVLPFYLYHLYLYGQWTVMDSSFLKRLTGTARTCGTRDKFLDFTVHYCPLSRYKRTSVTPVTPVTPDFLKVSRVLRTCIMRPGAMRVRLRGTREKFTHYSVTGVTVQNPIHIYRYIQMFSKNSHGYRARTYGTREKVTILSVLSVCVWVGVGGGCFPYPSRVPRTRSTHEESYILSSTHPHPHSVPVPL